MKISTHKINLWVSHNLKISCLIFSFIHCYVADNENCDLMLSQVLSFFTGAEYPPPLGFDTDPTIRFCNSLEFPTASTCALEMTIPTKYHDSPQDFHDKMLYAFKNHGGFGLW